MHYLEMYCMPLSAEESFLLYHPLAEWGKRILHLSVARTGGPAARQAFFSAADTKQVLKGHHRNGTIKWNMVF